jgi:hypothetical protein
MWKYIGGESGPNIPGVPAGPDITISDAEMAELEERIGGAAGSLTTCQHPEEERGGAPGHSCVLYEHVADRPERAERGATANARERKEG